MGTEILNLNRYFLYAKKYFTSLVNRKLNRNLGLLYGEYCTGGLSTFPGLRFLRNVTSKRPVWLLSQLMFTTLNAILQSAAKTRTRPSSEQNPARLEAGVH